MYVDATMEVLVTTAFRMDPNKEKPAAAIRTLTFRKKLKECGVCNRGFFLLPVDLIDLFNIIVIPLTSYTVNHRPIAGKSQGNFLEISKKIVRNFCNYIQYNTLSLEIF